MSLNFLEKSIMFILIHWPVTCFVGFVILVLFLVRDGYSYKRDVNKPLPTDWKREFKDDSVYFHPPTVVDTDDTAAICPLPFVGLEFPMDDRFHCEPVQSWMVPPAGGIN